MPQKTSAIQIPNKTFPAQLIQPQIRNTKNSPPQNAKPEPTTAASSSYFFSYVRCRARHVTTPRPLPRRQPHPWPPIHPPHASATPRRGTTPPSSERAADDATRAVGSRPRERGGAAGGAAERLGVLEAGVGFGHALELGVRWCRIGRVGAESEGESRGPLEALGHWLRGAMFVSYGVRDR